MPITTWPIRAVGTPLLASVARIAIPPSWVVEKREKSPGARLSTRMSARGSRRPPSTMTIASCAMDHPLLVQEHRGDPRTVLDEVLHADVHVDGALAAPEAAALDAEALGERQPQPGEEDVHEDLVDRERAVAEVHVGEPLRDRHRRRIDRGEPRGAPQVRAGERLRGGDE